MTTTAIRPRSGQLRRIATYTDRNGREHQLALVERLCVDICRGSEVRVIAELGELDGVPPKGGLKGAARFLSVARAAVREYVRFAVEAEEPLARTITAEETASMRAYLGLERPALEPVRAAA